MKDLAGLILRGGKSKRMGKDKALLNFHGKPQQEYLLEMFEQLGIPCHFSINQDQLGEIPQSSSYILDHLKDIGPIGGIYSGLKKLCHCSLIVLAVDMPMISLDYVQKLLKNRKVDKDGTFFFNENRQAIEPLFGIWESKAISIVKEAIENKQYSLRKILAQMNLEVISHASPDTFLNINRPDDFDSWEAKFGLE